jgi:hypothetical protein
MEDNVNNDKEMNSLVEQNQTSDSDETNIISSIAPFFKKGEAALLREIKRLNEVENLLLIGRYKKIKDKNFGFFKDIRHISGKELFFPILNTSINLIFVPPNYLSDGSIYTFEVKIAKEIERQNQKNPFLLQTKMESIEESIQLSKIQSKILEENKLLLDIQEKATDIIKQYDQTIDEKENFLSNLNAQLSEEENKLLLDIQEKATGIIKQYDQTIDEKENFLSNLNAQLSEIKTQLSEYSNTKSQMEDTLNFLRQKIDVCKNLEFLSEQDGNRYLDVLKTAPFEVGENYLDFERELSANYPRLVTHIQNYLYFKKNLIYTEFQIKNFLSLLMTNDLIILSGLSGSGKTQIVKSFAEVLGGVAKIIPVKPNWTSSDDLIGYYNPIQSSFLPTPFTEAIAEAIQNPHKIYLICLDEMNLARAEYYFADFLSKMEEKGKQPEIDLYAKHQEELFISEFKTLLTLIESATGEKMVSSWQEFLETDSIRKRFFELLGNTEKETLLQIHSKMRRRLLDILKFPASIKIPNNIRFVGAINVDETTHYFSPKILDRVHIVKFENPLLIEDEVKNYMENSHYETELKPVYLNPIYLGSREELPSLSSNEFITKNLKELNKDFLLPLSIDFGVRSMRQSINYAKQYAKVSALDTEGDYLLNEASALNTIINQKILPRFIFDGSEKLKNGEMKTDLLDKLATYVQEKISPIFDSELGNYEVGFYSDDYIRNMVTNAKLNNNQVNFYA